MTLPKVKLVCALSALTAASVMGQSPCVQLDAVQLSSCPCDEATLSFTLQETVTFNLALVIDGSSSVTSSDFENQKEFAYEVVGLFANIGHFQSGEKASYVQYADALVSSGTFDTMQGYESYVNADAQSQTSPTTPHPASGIEEATALLGNDAATYSAMIVITGGESSTINDSKVAADAARAAGIVVYAVGVGNGVHPTELVFIGGDSDHVYEATGFDTLTTSLMTTLFLTIRSPIVRCSSAEATLTMTFSVPVDSTTSGSISGQTVAFSALELTSDPIELDAKLSVCLEAPGDSVVVSVDYNDDAGNTPDLSLLTGLVVGEDFCGAPEETQPPEQHQPHPKRGRRLRKGKAKHSRYLGCYVDDSHHRALDGPMSSSDHMTAQMCADTCSSSGHRFFGTSSSDCRCGSSKPSKKGGVCDYECSGDKSRACGGVDSMSIYKSDNYRGRGHRGGGRHRGRGN